MDLEFALTSEETAVEAEILLEKIRDFQKCFQMPQGYIAANDGRSLGYAIKDLLSYLQKSQNKVDDQEFLFGLLLSRTMVELTYCISLKKNTQGVIYLKKACDYIDKHFLEEPGLVGVHPNDNTATVWLKTEDLIRIIEEHEHDVTLVSLD